MPGFGLYAKMFAAGAVMCIGGPALVYYVSPTEDELFKKYNPELQKRSLANRHGRQEEFDKFVGRLKEYSKSDKPIWEVAAEEDARRKARGMEDQTQRAEEIGKRREEMRRQSISPE